VTHWYLEPFSVFDLESTGVDTRADRIVTGYVSTVRLADGRREVTPGANVLVNPGIPIPPAASFVHGVTDKMVQERGCDPRDGLHSLAEALYRSLLAHIPVVGFNVAYDFSLLHWELIRHDLPTIGERLGRSRDAGFGPIIDAYVLDKQVDPYRKGPRTLGATCLHYGIDLQGAHAADADALASARVAVKIAKQYPLIGQMATRPLHVKQKGWRALQASGLEAYFRKTRPDAFVDRCWPICVDLTHPTT
jgi:DNA polymerase-3 subunit epsilon